MKELVPKLSKELFELKIKIDFFEARPLSLFLEVDSKFIENNFQKYISNIGVSKNTAKCRKSSKRCRYLWESLAVNPDGSFSPCPITYKDSDAFGKINEKSNIKEAVNNEKYQESRKLYVLNNYKTSVFTPCRRCQWFTKT